VTSFQYGWSPTQYAEVVSSQWSTSHCAVDVELYDVPTPSSTIGVTPGSVSMVATLTPLSSR
jgi:hypothetical protein